MNTTNKNELRQKYRALRDSFGEDFIKQASALACQKLINSPEFLNADTILLYYPTKNEISPLPIFDVCLKMGKTVAFPVCQKESTTLLFRKISALDELFLSSFGILEPISYCEQITPNEKTLCIVPALLFSQNGRFPLRQRCGTHPLPPVGNAPRHGLRKCGTRRGIFLPHDAPHPFSPKPPGRPRRDSGSELKLLFLPQAPAGYPLWGIQNPRASGDRH